MQFFDLPHRALFFKSPRSNDERLGEEVAQSVSFSSITKIKPSFVLVGHPDDEGVRSNHGRAGAQDGPDAIRAMLYKLTAGRDNFEPLYDLGNFIQTGTLAERQQQELTSIQTIFESKHRLISLGGGHDHAYADVGGMLKAVGKQKALVINIDAHLDMRAVVDSPNSGTAFFQLIEEFENFELIQVGIQPQANTAYYFDYAKKNKVKIYDLLDCAGQLQKVFYSIFKNVSLAKRPTFISIDMDAFSSAYAPGVSAASPIGLDPHEFLRAIPELCQKLDIRGLGFYEVAPRLDQDNQTSKLTAHLIHAFMYHLK